MWKRISGSVQGTSHVQLGIPCQDYCAVTISGETLIAACADGAGSAEFSQFGSKAAVDRFMEVASGDGAPSKDQVEGDLASAEARIREAMALLETRYPQTNAINGARARLAAFLTRRGRTAEAMTEYREVVKVATGNRTTISGLGNLLSPYFAILAEQIPANPALADDMFLASQTLIRPGVADTQAILSRELSEGNGDAARLFRQARTLERDIERSRIDLATLLAAPSRTQDIEVAAAALRIEIENFQRDQSATQARLADYPQFRAISNAVVTLDEMKAALRPGEAYFKVSVVGRSLYAMFADSAGATGYRIPLEPAALDINAANGLPAFTPSSMI